jgi:hypothetical protein
MVAGSNKQKIIFFFSKPFPFLDDAKSKVFLVVFSGIFSTFFILIYNPFNLDQIRYDSALGHYLPIWSAGIFGAIILSITQFLLRPRFNLSRFNLRQFTLWSIFEFMCLCISFYLLFGESKEPFITEVLLIIKYTISLAIIPYLLAYLLIAVFKLKTQVEQKVNSPKPSSNQQIFTHENGTILFGIKAKQILYLKSENNYTSIYYDQDGKVEKKLIRTNLKSISKTIVDNLDLMRIHRSFMVNLQKVEIIHREKGGFQLQLEHLPNSLFKVSETYKDEFEIKIKIKIKPHH